MRIRSRVDINGKSLTIREAQLADSVSIQSLFQQTYRGKYPLDFGNDIEVLNGEIQQSDDYLWLVVEDDDDSGRSLSGAMMFSIDRKNRMGKSAGGVVVPRYRHLGLGSMMLKLGIQYITETESVVDVIYGTTRTESEGPSKLVAEAGFYKMGLFPNAVQIEELEHLNLDIYFNDNAIKTRRRKPILYPPFAEIYNIARKELNLERAYLVTEREPLSLNPKKMAFDVVQDEKSAGETFAKYVDEKRICNSFFPFHKPNWVLQTPDQGTDIFVWFGGVGKQASILGYRSDRVNLHDVLDSAAISLHRMGAAYVELLISSYDYISQQQAFAAKFIPSAYFPAMRLAQDGLRDDYFILSRTFQIIDFSHAFVTGDVFPYLQSYMRFYNDLYISPVQRSAVRRKSGD